MWSCDRRAFLLGALALPAACGFTPVYGPEGAGTRLLNALALPDPGGDNEYALNARLEERLGRAAPGAPYKLDYTLQTDAQDVGATSAGNITQVRLIGRVFYALKDAGTGAILRGHRTNAFTSYSTTGSTVATSAAKRDAEERLMVILADQMIDDLVLHAADPAS